MRQIEQYERGPVLKYDREHIEDEYGGLGDQPLDRDDFASFEEFDAARLRPSSPRPPSDRSR